MIECDIQEPEEQTIVRNLGGLEPKYGNVVELQQFTTVNKVCVLPHKVEQQKKTRQPFKCKFTKPPPQNPPFNKGSPRPFPMPTNPSPSSP